MPKSKRELMKKQDDEEEDYSSEETSDSEDISDEDEDIEDEDIEDENEDDDTDDEDEATEDEESEPEESETEINNETTTINESSIDEQSEDGIIDMTKEENNKIEWKVVNKEERLTDNFLSDYEYVRALSIRTKHIALGAKILLKNAEELRKHYTPKEIAILEIKNKSCPLIIVRQVPNGNVEHWSINELDILFNI